jgi:phage terminase large subunit-like protein
VLRSTELHKLVHSAVQEAKGKQKKEVPLVNSLEGYRRINHANGSRIQIFAASDATGDGIIPTLAVVDEPHRQRDLSLYRTWSGKLRKRKGQIVAISTSGDPLGEFEQTRARIHASASKVTKRGSFTRVQTPRVVLHEWAVPEDKDPSNMRTVKAANPFSGITVRMLKEAYESPTMTMAHWLRFVCNRPHEDEECWLGDNARSVWGSLAQPWELVDKADTYVGIDMSLKRDATAVVWLQKRGAGWHAKHRIWTPTQDRPVDATEVMAHIRDLSLRYHIKAISYDPRFFDVPAKMLEDEGLPMIEVPQSLERMTQAIGGCHEAIKSGLITHDGGADFAAHILAAVARQNDRGFTLSKSKSRAHIDAAIALSLAFDRVQRHESVGPSVYETRGVLTI